MSCTLVLILRTNTCMFSKVTGDIMSLELNLFSPRVTCDDWSQWGPVINMFCLLFSVTLERRKSKGDPHHSGEPFCQAVDTSNRSKFKGAPKGSRCSTAQEVQEHTEERAASKRSHSLRRRGHSRLRSIGNYLHKYQERPSAPLDTFLTGYKDSRVQVGSSTVGAVGGRQVKSGQTRRSRLNGFAFDSETVHSRNVSNRMRFFSRVLLVASEGPCGVGRGRRDREQVTTPIGWN